MYEITMPKLSDSMLEGKIIEWKVKEGDAITEGDIIADIESDKAVMELEAFEAGVVQEIRQQNGAEVKVGEVIAVIASAGEAKEKPAEKKEEKTKTETLQVEPEEELIEEQKPELETVGAEQRKSRAQTEGGRKWISPYAKKLAENKGIDWTEIEGSGPGGRIVAADIEGAGTQGATAAPAPGQEEPSPAQAQKMRKEKAPAPERAKKAEPRAEEHAEHPAPAANETIPPLELQPGEAEAEEPSYRLKTQARRVTAVKQNIPHFYLTRPIDVTALVAKKDEIKKKHGATITHVIMLACLKAIEKYPQVNKSYDSGKLIKWNGVNLGLAVDTEEGLTVAVIAGAEKLTLGELVEKSNDLFERARSGKLSAEERKHASITISNLGMMGIEHFQPIINPPSAITLGIGMAKQEAIVAENCIRIGTVMRVTASCDHRAVDGATGARFLAELARLLENPDEIIK